MAVPALTPVTMPVELPIVTDPVPAVVAHVPPDVALLSVVVVPGQTVSSPDIAAGNGFTVTGRMVVQPMPDVYVIIAVPGVTPVTIPVVEPMVTEPVPGDALQVPPLVASVSVVVKPTHTLAVPAIAATVFTVTTAVV